MNRADGGIYGPSEEVLCRPGPEESIEESREETAHHEADRQDGEVEIRTARPNGQGSTPPVDGVCYAVVEHLARRTVRHTLQLLLGIQREAKTRRG